MAKKSKTKETDPEVTQFEYEQKHPTKRMRGDKETDRNQKRWEKENGVKMDQNAWSDHPTKISRKVASATKASPKKTSKKKSTKRVNIKP